VSFTLKFDENVALLADYNTIYWAYFGPPCIIQKRTDACRFIPRRRLNSALLTYSVRLSFRAPSVPAGLLAPLAFQAPQARRRRCRPPSLQSRISAPTHNRIVLEDMFSQEAYRIFVSTKPSRELRYAVFLCNSLFIFYSSNRFSISVAKLPFNKRHSQLAASVQQFAILLL